MGTRGFILQATYRVARSGGSRATPVVHLYGRLESGGTFLVRDDRQRPRFHIRAVDADRARALGAREISPTQMRTFDGEPAWRVDVAVPADVPPLRDRLHAAGVDTFEADVRFPVRYLIERNIRGGCDIEGGAATMRNGMKLFHNPVLHPAEVSVEPRVLSFDIETDPQAERLLAIALYGPGIDEVLIVCGSERAMPANARCCPDEHDALSQFCARVHRLDPDVLTGWNIIDFDLTVLERIAARIGHPLDLGRDEGGLRIRRAEGFFRGAHASIPGRLVLDGIELLRGAFVRMEDYSLDAVARAVLGEGKAMQREVSDRAGEILHNYRNDLQAFARYARTDARLAYDILARLELIKLAFARSSLAGMTPDRVSASIASFDFVYLSELHPRGIVAPSVRTGEGPGPDAQQGGHVLEPVSGLHRNVWVFDFKSLYPNIIRTFNIDPLCYSADAPPGADLIRTPGGSFRRAPAILPGVLDALFPRREAAKRAGDQVAANAIKILMNSFYGVLGTSACRFYNPALANSITGTGKEILLWSKGWFENAGYPVLYGDTDSLFVGAGHSDPAALVERGSELAAQLNGDLGRYVLERWGLASHLELEFEKLYLRLFLPRARHSERGASKRYAGLLHGEAGVEFVGMEVVRRDWTALARQVQRELYERLFTDRPVEAYLQSIVRAVRAGEHDTLLVYRKNLRKGADAYTATTPPHVAAARKSPGPPARTVRYVMTTDGPEPLDNLRHPIDHEHYIARQIRPVAEPVLATLALDFDAVIGDARQVEMPF